jgi:Tfp pilus assembly protein PilO
MQIFSTPLTGFMETLLLVAAIVVGVIYIFSNVRKQDLEVLRSSNDDLRKAIDDKTKEIEVLQAHLQVVENQMGIVQQKVYSLEKQNGDLQSLVKAALVNYFQNNPEIAQDFHNTPSSNS